MKLPLFLEDLQRLPLRYAVALGVRCARRVQPLYALWEGAEPEQLRIIEDGLQRAEACALGKEADLDTLTESVYSVAAKTAAQARMGSDQAQLAAYAGATAHAVTDAAAELLIDPVAVRTGVLYAERTCRKAEPDISAVIWHDFRILLPLASSSSDDLGPPIDSSEAGPLEQLWPQEHPAWWAEGQERLQAVLERA